MTLIAHLSTLFFFNDTATTEIYTLSLHDALPIFVERSDRLMALREARRILKPQGVLIAAAISRFASFIDGLARGFFRDRKSTRLNSSHGYISYAVFCLK